MLIVLNCRIFPCIIFNYPVFLLTKYRPCFYCPFVICILNGYNMPINATSNGNYRSSSVLPFSLLFIRQGPATQQQQFFWLTNKHYGYNNPTKGETQSVSYLHTTKYSLSRLSNMDNKRKQRSSNLVSCTFGQEQNKEWGVEWMSKRMGGYASLDSLITSVRVMCYLVLVTLLLVVCR